MQAFPDSISTYKNPRVFAMLFLGFSAGLPWVRIFGTLGVWLRAAGVERSAGTYFSWAWRGTSYTFVWGPRVDK